jgi:hypothetical protein
VAQSHTCNPQNRTWLAFTVTWEFLIENRNQYFSTGTKDPHLVSYVSVFIFFSLISLLILNRPNLLSSILVLGDLGEPPPLSCPYYLN